MCEFSYSFIIFFNGVYNVIIEILDVNTSKGHSLLLLRIKNEPYYESFLKTHIFSYFI